MLVLNFFIFLLFIFLLFSEPKFWYWEVIVILKKMLLTGAMTIIVPGSSAQLVIALLIVFINTSLVLKLAPFVDEADDWLAFLTNIQMVITLLGGLLLMTDDSTAPTYDSNFMGIALVVINSFGFIALLLGLLGLHPAVRRCVNKTNLLTKKNKETEKDKNSTQVVPVDAVEENKKILNKVKNWGQDDFDVSLLEEDEEEEKEKVHHHHHHHHHQHHKHHHKK